LCQCQFVNYKSTGNRLGLNPVTCGERPTTNRLNPVTCGDRPTTNRLNPVTCGDRPTTDRLNHGTALGY